MTPDPRLAAIADDALQEVGLTGRSFASSGLLSDFLHHAVAATRGGRRLSPTELAGCSDAGAQAARLGVAPRVAVDLFLSAAWRLWRDLPDLAQAGGEREAALWLMRVSDDGVAALIEGFQEARAGIVRMEAAHRQELLEALLAGGQTAQASLERAEAMGLSLTGPVLVLVADSRPPFPEILAQRLPPEVERALRGRFSDSFPLVTMREGSLLVLAAAPDRQAEESIGAAVEDVLRARVGAFDAAETDWRIAVSSPRVGPTAVHTSYAEAREVLDLARRVGLEVPVAHSADLAIYRVLLRDREAAWDLIETTLNGLRDARDGGTDLLATLIAYFDNRGNTTATAAAMHLSVRAVSYRLQRIAELLGRDPNDPREWLTLHTAARTATLLGWPAQGR